MGFFGQLVEKDNVLEVPVPDEYCLHLRQVCIVPEMIGKSKVPVFVRVKTANDDEEIVVAVLDPSHHQYSARVELEFGPEDSPVSISATHGSVHVSGHWSWDDEQGCDHHDHDEDEDDDECSDDDDDEEENDAGEYEREQDGEQDSDDDEEENEEAPMLVEIEEEVRPVASKTAKEQKKVAEVKAKLVKEDVVKTTAVEPAKKKARVEEAQPVTSSLTLKKWKVFPDCDEGVAVPEPKTVKKGGGLEITDFIIGNGAVPKGGATVKITYEGLFPDGKVFDSRLKRKSPFSFRKGTGQVIKGMDMGMEGMRIGGAREILIPSHLGYGEKGAGQDIPGNQTLIFRIRLVA